MNKKESRKMIREYEQEIEESKIRFYEAAQRMEQNIQEMRDAM